METFKRTPLELFHLPQNIIVPLFQRRYVWSEDDQWAPLWRDLRHVIEQRIQNPFQNTDHFFGAIVLQKRSVQGGSKPASEIIDGQQRLTTVHLLASAAHRVLSRTGYERQAEQVRELTHNSPTYLKPDESALKLVHENKDRDSFHEVMDLLPDEHYGVLSTPNSTFAQAHSYFSQTIADWLESTEGAPQQDKAEHLASALHNGLILVVIELEPYEDSQEIFETLNARGTPLGAADLVRNYVFQRLAQEDADREVAYKEQWPFEKEFWSQETRVGSQKVSRNALFLHQWLVAKTGEDISTGQTFSRFKRFVEQDSNMSMSQLLPKLRVQADQYEQWMTNAMRRDGNLTTIEQAFYRLQAGRFEFLKPILIWVADPDRSVPQQVQDQVVTVFESWLYRRLILRLSTSNMPRVVSDVITAFDQSHHNELVQGIQNHLSGLDSVATYWPSDEAVREELRRVPAYTRYRRARLRTILEALENDIRAETSQPQVERGHLPIEHILPQGWQMHWPVEDVQGQIKRQSRVHRLGNLTLLTSSLNSSLSNKAWDEKRIELLHHNTIKMTGRVVEEYGESGWNENAIDSRTDSMINRLLRIWPVPKGHTGQIADHEISARFVWIKDLVDAGLIAPGTELVTRHPKAQGATATVLPDGMLEIDGKKFRSPSPAVRYVLGRHQTPWLFWRMPDGRTIAEDRRDYRKSKAGYTDV
ncbi:GmrSD restriction endonuclease domain-containing protein [Micrococcoides hystricis]|uniref:DUF262 domain-containing protein n=1 Tax=Micrococcoides hystricis TaxID=1572761 RepID=A0ABV6PCD6_9MICC